MAHRMDCSFTMCPCVLSFAVLSVCREGSLSAPTVDAEDVLVKCSFWTDLISVGLWGLSSLHFSHLQSSIVFFQSLASETNL